MGKQFTLGSQERLKSRKLIEQLFKEGRSLVVFPFRVHYLFRNKEAPGISPAPGIKAGMVNVQCGFGASSRQFKKAVDRNRIKRLTREAWRLQRQPLTDALAGGQQQLALFLVYTGKELPDFNTVKEKVAVILNRLTAVIHEKGKNHT